MLRVQGMLVGQCHAVTYSNSNTSHISLSYHSVYVNYGTSAAEEHPAQHVLASLQPRLSHPKPMSEPQEIRLCTHIDRRIHTGIKTARVTLYTVTTTLQCKTLCPHKDWAFLFSDILVITLIKQRHKKIKYGNIPPVLSRKILVTRGGEWDLLGLWQDFGLLCSGLAEAQQSVC